MAHDFDLVIRRGTIVDGSGAERFEGDVAIASGRIAAVGKVSGAGVEEIDAKGKLVTPGFIDIHTHYDGQVIWSSHLAPSSSHGVTTTVGGNCGVGFAPCRPEHRELLVNVMEGVEVIPEAVMAEGLPWDWETYPEYLTAIEKRPHDIDFASQIPHAALRVFVMGQRGADRETPTDDDLGKMRTVVREAMAAGAVGFATSRVFVHRTGKGDFIPIWGSTDRELEAIALGLKDAGRGVIQAAFGGPDITFQGGIDTLSRMAQVSGRPASFSMIQEIGNPDGWRPVMKHLAAANGHGPRIRAQIFPRLVGMMLGFETSVNPFTFCPSYEPIATLPFARRIETLRDPQVRARLLADEPRDVVMSLKQLNRRFEVMYPLGDPPNYEPAPETSIAAQAAARGLNPLEIAYDLMLENDGRGLLVLALTNYGSGSLDPILTLMTDANSVLGLGDGGAHYAMICDSSFPTYMLQHWTRDRKGARLSIEQAVKMLCADPAGAVELGDRGVLSVGRKADVNVIDYDNLRLGAPQVLYDLPAGGRRLHQKARGYDATIVAGQVISRGGTPTGALPGRLVRGPQAARI